VLAPRSILTAALGLLFVSTNLAQEREENYSEIFAGDYQRIINYLQTEKGIDSIIRSHQLNPKEVVAVIFPELIRYNSIQDRIETFALETLYVQYGKEYANFSVGEFQIKPFFAERIEIDFMKKFGVKELAFNFQINATDTLQNEETRMKRLKRIKSNTGMTNYLCLFWKVMNANYPTWKREEDKIKFFATAYNCGYWKSRKEIGSFQSKKFFYTGFSITSTKYNYADIAWYYFQRQ
jgi:hypothetical protein